nr:MAG TPA: hypothetical protein [Caudoviricetes sp.]DAU97573.1 MAG TPA: hypothetical protein [Caudoviricetes sp.]
MYSGGYTVYASRQSCTVWFCAVLVQAEIARRKSLGRAYSGKSVHSAKLVCEDCGGFFGSKVWHSTDCYRRTI